MNKSMLEKSEAGELGSRIERARRSRKLTQQQLADSLGVARTTVTAIEKGVRSIRPEELVQIASLTGRPLRYFLSTSLVSPDEDFSLRFRAVASPNSDEMALDEDIVAFQELCEWYIELEQRYSSPLPRFYPEPYPVATSSPERSAEDVAILERNRLGVGDGPLSDLWGLLESDIGIRVFSFPMRHTKIAGVFLYSERYGGCIAVNSNHPPERQRMSAAHEFGHFLTSRYQVDLSLLSDTLGRSREERFAEAFARNFLMPASGLRRRFESVRRANLGAITPADLLTICDLYRVSFQAMCLRLEELGLIPRGAWEKLKREGFKPNHAKKLVGIEVESSLGSSASPRYAALNVRAFLEGYISEGQLAERLMTDRIGARNIVLQLESSLTVVGKKQWEQLNLNWEQEIVEQSRNGI